MTLREIITPAKLRKLAGPKSYARGEAYLAQGAVRKLHCTDSKATATVQGSVPYQVRIWANRSALQCECNCPFAMDMGAYCKHIVAVGLALLETPLAQAHTPPAEPERATDPWAGLARHLRGLGADELANLLIEAAREDPQLQRKLMKLAEPAPFDERALRALIDGTMDKLPDFVPWDEVAGAAMVLGEMLGKLLDARTATTALALIPLLEYAYERLDRFLEQVDDSHGIVADVLLDIGQAHFDTCELARPDPCALAERLFALAMRSQTGTWDFGPVAYGGVLGEAGRQRYLEVVQAAWRALPLKSRASDRASLVGRLMRELGCNDVDHEVEMLARDLSDVHRYRLIAEALRDAGRLEQAADWARRGLKVFPGRLDGTLCGVAVDYDLVAGRGEQAIALRLRQLKQSPSVPAYEALAATAHAAGAWPACRDQAWQVIAEQARKHGETRCTLQVAIALWEENLELAMEQAEAGPCAPAQMLALATALEGKWPDEAFEYYRRLVRSAMELSFGSSEGYAEAFEYVQRIARLLGGLGRSEECAGYLAYLRTEYKRKRNFMKLLDSLA